MARAKIVEINKTLWVAGLAWSTFDEKPKQSEIREDATRFGGADWYAVRDSDVAIQGGFCDRLGEKVPRKLASLAAYLADSAKEPWLGIFQITEELWWYIAVRDHQSILPDGDVIGTKEEIDAAREGHSGYQDWEYIEGDLETLASMIAEVNTKPSYIRLLMGQEDYRKRLIRWGVASGLGVALLLSAYAAYQFWDTQRVAQANAAQERLRLMLKKEADQKHPLITTGLPSRLLSACEKHLVDLPLSLFGWAVQSVECTPGAIKVLWQREAGATVNDRPPGDVSQDGERISSTTIIDIGLGNNNALPLEEAILRLHGWAQQGRLALKLEADNKEKTPNQAKFVFHTTVSPWDFELDIPGVRLTLIRTTSYEPGWKTEGVVYGKQ